MDKRISRYPSAQRKYVRAWTTKQAIKTIRVSQTSIDVRVFRYNGTKKCLALYARQMECRMRTLTECFATEMDYIDLVIWIVIETGMREINWCAEKICMRGRICAPDLNFKLEKYAWPIILSHVDFWGGHPPVIRCMREPKSFEKNMRQSRFETLKNR